MTPPKHTPTPGPWSANRWTEHAGDHYIISPTAGILASVAGRGGEFAEEDAANARLIASAPSLLAALEASVRLDEARSVIDAWCDVNAPVYPDTPQQMRDAMNARDRAEKEFRALRAAALSAAKGGEG